MNIPGRKSTNGRQAETLPPPVQRPLVPSADAEWTAIPKWPVADGAPTGTSESPGMAWGEQLADFVADPPRTHEGSTEPRAWPEPTAWSQPDIEAAWTRSLETADPADAHAPVAEMNGHQPADAVEGGYDTEDSPVGHVLSEPSGGPLDTWTSGEDPGAFDGRVASAFRDVHPSGEPEAGVWRVDSAHGSMVPMSAVDVLTSLGDKVNSGHVEQYQPVPLGFTPLDRTIGGGLRVGELLLIGGAQGTGKTTMALQMARNIVLGGQSSVLYVCFEHDEEYLLNRLIAMESALAQTTSKANGIKLQDVRKEILGTWLAQGSGTADLSMNPRLRPALERIGRYGQNLFLLRGSQTSSTIENLRELVTKYRQLAGERNLVVFIDYLQKVPMIPEPDTETEKVTFVVNGLKDIALTLGVPMISIVAADKEGLKAKRLRNFHLRGSSAINYEADIIMILNEKYNIVAKVNIEFNPYMAQRFRDWVVLSVEKNRGGQHAIDLEFEKHFEYSCFDANGRTVQEKLVEERLFND